MTKIEPCDLGYRGECCCNCQFQVPIRKRLDRNVVGYVCVAFYMPRTYRASEEMSEL